MGHNQQPKGGGYARNKGTQPYAGSKGGNKSKTVDAAAALGLLRLATEHDDVGPCGTGSDTANSFDSLFGSVGTNPLAGIISWLEYRPAID